MENIINKPTEDNWINGIDNNEPWKYLWQFDAMIWEDEGYAEFTIKNRAYDSDLENEFQDTVRYKQWFMEFYDTFRICESEAYVYYSIFKYLGKNPEVTMRNLTNMALLEKI